MSFENTGKKENIQPVSPDILFLEDIIDTYGDEFSLGGYDLMSLERNMERGLQSEKRAYELIEELYNQNSDSDPEEKRSLRRKARGEFKEFVLQTALLSLDSKMTAGTDYKSAIIHVCEEVFGNGFRESNIAELSDVYQKLNEKFNPYRSDDIEKKKDVLQNFTSLVEPYISGSASEDDMALVRKLIRAAKGVYQRGTTTIEVPAEYAVIVDELARLYKKTRPVNNLDAGSVQGSDVYEAGVYAGENYEKTQRPRRYGDGLGSN